MIRRSQVIAFLIFCVILASAAGFYAAGIRHADRGGKGYEVSVEIDYGGKLPLRKADVVLPEGGTVLAALQSVADVGTHRAGGYVFVVSIDGVEGARGENAWYYTIDGENPGELAYSKVIASPAHIKWSYRKDVCSGKVDNENEASAGKEEGKG
ncbi:MAG: DUF4430 domain-containing protein [Candidatus Omnitrophica bacterium]|nr:DUF4430 domain-containing protein [Candidatus Omnitrophota bacterium]